jgi:RimJ/RimL family protein N-acetyltransferase
MEYHDFGCRRTVKKDISFWKDIYSDCDVKEHMNAAPLETDREFWEYLNRSERFVVFQSEDLKEILIGGFTLYHRDNKSAEFGIVTHPNFRGMGLGRIIVEFLEETAKDLGIKTLKADVYADNKACLSLLNKNDFKPIVFLEKNL